MKRTQKMTRIEAKRAAQRFGISFKVDFHTLRSSQVDYLLELCKKVGYRKPQSASGSTARYFFYYLEKAKQ